MEKIPFCLRKKEKVEIVQKYPNFKHRYPPGGGLCLKSGKFMKKVLVFDDFSTFHKTEKKCPQNHTVQRAPHYWFMVRACVKKQDTSAITKTTKMHAMDSPQLPNVFPNFRMVLFFLLHTRLSSVFVKFF